jgi:hypothetical protein
MNDLCISVGDFGGYVNVAGNYTKNFETFNINDLDSSKYNYGNQGNNYSSNGDIGPWKIQEYLKGFSEINSPTNTPQFNFPVVGDSNNNLQDPANINLANIKDISGIISAVSGAVGAVAGVGLTVVAAIGGTGALLGPVGIPLLIIAALAAIVLAVEQIFGFGQTKTIPVSFQCEAWQPPKGGGADCSLCNQGPLPCTQYMCYSLGQACQYSENLYYSQQNPQCISMVDDHAAPVISFANISGNYLVTNITQNNLVIGVNISEPDGSCIPAYTSLNITLVTTNATGQLKYSECAYNWSLQSPPPSSDNGWTLNEKNPFSEKSFLSFNHTLVNLQMPPVSSLPSVDISSGYPGQRTGEVNLYMRCEDAFSPPNSNPVPYIINFCEKEAPDTQIAQISSSSPTNASYLAYKIYNANLIMQISKPAYCSFNYGQDEPYSSMAPMTCTYNPDYVGLGGTCNATLTGLNALQNNIYIKCEDQPWLAGINESQRNINNVGFLYTLYDSQSPLNISSMSVQSGTSPVSLNGNIPTLKSGTSPVSIQLSATTSGGADGSAICNYQLIGVGGADTFFSDINGLTTKHTQPFNLVGGAYNVQINCTDSAGNSAIANGLFNVQIDNIPPSVTRVYKSGDNLVINTDKIAMCYYSTIGCSYDIKGQNSVQMDSLFTTSHSTNWNSGLTYYVRCIDVYGNINNGCAIVVSPGT